MVVRFGYKNCGFGFVCSGDENVRVSFKEFLSIYVCLCDVLCEIIGVGIVGGILLDYVVGNSINNLSSGFILELCW